MDSATTKQVSEVQPLGSVIIPCRNEVDHIEMCLRSVLSQQRPEGGFEVIVADGMSDDGTRDVIRKVTEATGGVIRVIDNPERIAAAGLNAAIFEARGKIIIRVDAHCEYA